MVICTWHCIAHKGKNMHALPNESLCFGRNKKNEHQKFLLKSLLKTHPKTMKVHSSWTITLNPKNPKPQTLNPKP